MRNIVKTIQTAPRWPRLARKLIVHAEHALRLSLLSRPLRYALRDAEGVTVLPLREAVPFHVREETHRQFYRRSLATAPREQPARTDPVYLVLCEDALFRGDSGSVFTADRHVLIDGDYYLRWKTGPRAYTGRLPAPRERIGGLCSSVWTGEHANYYHWLVDALLRLHSLEQYGEAVTLLMPSAMSVLQRESLQRCLPRNVSLRLVEEGSWFTVERFLVPSFLTPHTLRFLPPDSVRWLRERFIGSGKAPAGNGNRIYISRDDAARRRVSNEADVRRMLAAHGFGTVRFSQCTMEEQVAICAGASVLVGAHGAGLANLLFARPGAALVELCTRNLDATYLETALAAELRYRYLAPREYGVLPEGTPPRIALSALRDADNSYDVDALEAIVLQTLQEVA